MQLNKIEFQLIEIRESLINKDIRKEKLTYDIDSITILIEQIKESQVKRFNHTVGAVLFVILCMLLISFVMIISPVV